MSDALVEAFLYVDPEASVYVQLAAYGRFGRIDLSAPWERDDRAPDLTRAARSLG